MIKRVIGYLKHKKRRTEVSISSSINKLNKDTHQLTNVTKPNRYPEIFKACTAYAQQAGGNMKLLSFGCSTGDECISLHDYMPDATIYGADIVKSNLRKAERKVKNNKIKFFYSNEENLKEHGPYTMAFCMSVLCRWPNTEDTDDSSEVYPFSRFEDMCKTIDDQLEVNGLLIIYNANFRFNDTSLFEKYEVLPVAGIEHSGFVHHFDTSNKKIKGQIHKDCVFIKKR